MASSSKEDMALDDIIKQNRKGNKAAAPGRARGGGGQPRRGPSSANQRRGNAQIRGMGQTRRGAGRGAARGGRGRLNQNVKGRGRPFPKLAADRANARNFASLAKKKAALRELIAARAVNRNLGINRRTALQIVKKALLGRRTQARRLQRPGLKLAQGRTPVRFRRAARGRGAGLPARGRGSLRGGRGSVNVRQRLGWINSRQNFRQNRSIRGRPIRLNMRKIKGRGNVGEMASDYIRSPARRPIRRVSGRRGGLGRQQEDARRWLTARNSRGQVRGMAMYAGRGNRGGVKQRLGFQVTGRGFGRSPRGTQRQRRAGTKNFSVAIPGGSRSMTNVNRVLPPIKGVRASFSQSATGTTLNERFGGGDRVHIRGGRGGGQRKIFL